MKIKITSSLCAGCYEFSVEPPEEMKEMLWIVPSAPWHTISSSAELNGFTLFEVNNKDPKVKEFESRDSRASNMSSHISILFPLSRLSSFSTPFIKWRLCD